MPLKIVYEYTKIGHMVGFRLAGSSQTIDHALRAEGFNSDEIVDIENNQLFTEALDETALCCDICGWWSATEDVNDNFSELVCNECMIEGYPSEEE